MAFWIAIGAAIGAGLRVALDNMAVGVAFGIVLRAAMDAAQTQRNKKR